MKTLLLTLSLLLTYANSQAQWFLPPPPITPIFLNWCFGDIILSTQAEVDNCRCERIYGNLIIGVPSSQPGATAITNLSNIYRLTYVSKAVRIRRNPSLRQLQGLHNLATVGGELEIYDNKYLQSVQYLYNLRSVDSLTIERNASIGSLWGLYNLFQAKVIDIRSNSSLTSLVGLYNMRDMSGGVLKVVNNDALRNFTGLQNLKSLYELHVVDNYALEDLSGLGIVDSLEYLWIENNTSLTSLTGLENINHVKENLVRYNPQLSDCCIPIGLNGYMNAYSNAPSCNSTSDIRTSCSGARIASDGVDKENTFASLSEPGTMVEETMLQVFPNPTTNNIRVIVPTSQSGKLTVRDILGRAVHQTSFEGGYQEKLSLRPFGTGIYLVDVASGENQTTYKVIVQ